MCLKKARPSLSTQPQKPKQTSGNITHAVLFDPDDNIPQEVIVSKLLKDVPVMSISKELTYQTVRIAAQNLRTQLYWNQNDRRANPISWQNVTKDAQWMTPS